MSLGEKARLYIAGYKGYGEKGFSAWGVSFTKYVFCWSQLLRCMLICMFSSYMHVQ